MSDLPDAPFDVTQFIPHYLTTIGNTMTAAGSRWFLSTYGFGLNEGRIIGALGANPGSTAAALGQTMAMNKAIVSRGLTLLVEQGLIRGEGPSRGRRYFLTDRAEPMHRAIAEASLDSQRRILAGLSAGEVEALLDLLKKLSANVAREFGPEAL